MPAYVLLRVYGNGEDITKIPTIEATQLIVFFIFI